MRSMPPHTSGYLLIEISVALMILLMIVGFGLQGMARLAHSLHDIMHTSHQLDRLHTHENNDVVRQYSEPVHCIHLQGLDVSSLPDAVWHHDTHADGIVSSLVCKRSIV